MKPTTTLLLVFFSFWPSRPSAGQLAQGPLVFRHVAVVKTDTPSIRRDQTVIIQGSKIAAVDDDAKVAIPASARVIDATGEFLIPGLWDMHVHTFSHQPRSTNSWYFPLFIANGVTGVRDMWTTGDDMAQVAAFRRGLADGSFLGPRYAAVGWLVDGPDQPVFPYADIVKTPEEARAFVQKAKAAGVDFVKVYDKLSRDVYFAVADEARRDQIPFAGHVPISVSAAEASDAGQRTLEHFFGVDMGCSAKEAELLQRLRSKTLKQADLREMPATYDEQRCQRLGHRFVRNQTWLGLTFVVWPDTSDGRSRYLPARVRARWRELDSLGRSRPPQQTDELSPGQRMRLAIIAAMNTVGVPMMAGTDVANPYAYPGFSLHDVLATLVRAGLTPGQALQTATYNPAKFLGALDSLGTIATSKLADLVLLDADPLQDIRNTRAIRSVVLNGRYFDRAALDSLLARAADGARVPDRR